MKSQVLLINADYNPLGLITLHKALKLWSKGKIEVIKATKQIIRNFEQTIELFVPEVIRLLKYVRSIWRKKVPFSKRNLLIRDNFTCQYCGKEIKQDSSIDHIVPRSKGGMSSFDNCVMACIPCNNKKDNKSCAEAKMFPKHKPIVPTINEFLLLHIKNAGLNHALADLGL